MSFHGDAAVVNASCVCFQLSGIPARLKAACIHSNMTMKQREAAIEKVTHDRSLHSYDNFLSKKTNKQKYSYYFEGKKSLEVVFGILLQKCYLS